MFRQLRAIGKKLITRGHYDTSVIVTLNKSIKSNAWVLPCSERCRCGPAQDLTSVSILCSAPTTHVRIFDSGRI